MSGLATFIKVLAQFLVSKAVALVIGPTGLVYLGQLNSFTSLWLLFSTGSIKSGVTKYISEFKSEVRTSNSIISTSLLITIVCSMISAVLLYVRAEEYSNLIFSSRGYAYIINIFAMTILFYSINIILLAIINGYKKYKLYVKINIINSLLGLVLTIWLVLRYGLRGALVEAVTLQAITCFVTVYFIYSKRLFPLKLNLKLASSQFIRKLSAYSFMAAVPAFINHYFRIILRNHITDTLSVTDTGYWEGVSRISGLYFLILSTATATYILPRMSEIRDGRLLRKELFNSFKFIVPLTLLVSSAIYIFRDVLILLTLSNEFIQMRELFLFQMIGDTFKICGYILSSLMVAKAMARSFIVVEIAFGLFYFVLVYYGVIFFGIQGTVYAYAIMYLCNFVTLLIIFRKLIFSGVYNHG
ncbi:MAG: O-antigen translocase [Fermentimonas sp.]|nr:O-antigen translocase [Fermentimonas sp.]